ncbi:hypothetical protein BpHYR1_046673 [Brachionus plicatilis]|uniref:Uncharacterized protein n=1 Tax=Brachionus plicatilis TaxID=10195 RepID=A0A3M7RVQ7_BRAPC|nr:hypothetical protein BpHYR1_046673 [Brachionus plicatilis]
MPMYFVIMFFEEINSFDRLFFYVLVTCSQTIELCSNFKNIVVFFCFKQNLVNFKTDSEIEEVKQNKTKKKGIG